MNHHTTNTEIGARPMTTEDIQAIYAEKAKWFHRLEWIEQRVTGRYRHRLFGDVQGDVLDVACGTGTNFPYLTDATTVTGVDISPEMLENAHARFDQLDLNGQLYQMDAQALGFSDNRFDNVISALSTCTFPDPIAALNEMQRVCAPDGQIRLLEHGRSDIRPIAWYQDWRADAHYQKNGCRWTQDPLAIATDAGLTITQSQTALGGIITMITAHPN